MKILKAISIILIIAFLAIGCGSSGDGSGNNGGGGNALTESPQGVWHGTIYSYVTELEYNVLGIVSENNVLHIINVDTGIFYTGIVDGSGNKADFTVTSYTSDGSVQYVHMTGTKAISVQITGTITPRYILLFKYNMNGDNGTLTLKYNKAYERHSSLSTIDDVWTMLSGSDMLTIGNQGNMTGNFNFIATGCLQSGKVSIINSLYGVYLFNIDVSDCGAWNGAYSGLGFVGDYNVPNVPNDSLFYSISNSSNAIFVGYARL